MRARIDFAARFSEPKIASRDVEGLQSGIFGALHFFGAVYARATQGVQVVVLLARAAVACTRRQRRPGRRAPRASEGPAFRGEVRRCDWANEAGVSCKDVPTSKIE